MKIVTYGAGPGYDGMVPFTDAVAKQMVELGIPVQVIKLEHRNCQITIPSDIEFE